jgi:hypothetical protein
MNRFHAAIVALGLSAFAVSNAQAAGIIRITEYSSGATYDFVELTNVGDAPISLSNWSYNDNNVNNVIDLSAIGTVAVGESVVFFEDTVTVSDFKTEWGLGSGVNVYDILIDSNLSQSGDTVNIYNSLTQSGATLVDSVAYTSENGVGNTRNVKPEYLGNTAIPTSTRTAASVVSDAFGSYTSTLGSVGNPGTYVPEPTSLGLLALGGLVSLRRRRA